MFARIATGRSMGTLLLKRLCDSQLITQIWKNSERSSPDGRPCPSCRKPLTIVVSRDDKDKDSHLELDLCRPCYLMWFDPGEYDALPGQKKFPKHPEFIATTDTSEKTLQTSTPQEKLQQLPETPNDLIESESYKAPPQAKPAHPKFKFKFINQAISEKSFFQMLPMLVGLPIEYDDNPIKHRPLGTMFLIVATCLISLFALENLTTSIQSIGFHPTNHFFQTGLLTSFFIHGGLFHLFSNMYLLFIFGDNVEEDLGVIKFFLLIFFSTILGNLALEIFGLEQTVIGASGGVCGVATYYMLRFPRTRIASSVLSFLVLVVMPAWVALAVYAGFQIFGSLRQISGFGTISYLSHLGGIIAGFTCWFAWREK